MNKVKTLFPKPLFYLSLEIRPTTKSLNQLWTSIELKNIISFTICEIGPDHLLSN